MSVTTKDIARVCGVSRGTVDRALNGKSEIKLETREKIIKVAKELDYRPDLLARSLVKGESMSLGVVVFDVRNRYFAQMLNTIEFEAKKLGYFVYITLTEKDPQTEIDAINRLIDRRVDGIIVSPVNKYLSFDENFKNTKTPIVSVVNRISENWHYIGIDDKKAIRDGLDYILSKDYKRVVFLCPPLAKLNSENIYAQEQRVKGFREYFQDKPYLEHSVITRIDNDDMIIELTSQNKKTAIFCSSDTFALDILRRFKEMGKKVPNDIGLMGFDNIDYLEDVSPRLTTINNPIEQQAVCAVESLLNIINGIEVPKMQYISHSLIKRDSI